MGQLVTFKTMSWHSTIKTSTNIRCAEIESPRIMQYKQEERYNVTKTDKDEFLKAQDANRTDNTIKLGS